ncbi:MAG: hypothetical protein KDC49_10475 [Saprospiraceae bacterium]|nr:hypothetical protein [Saprospiraceae bacterium]
MREEEKYNMILSINEALKIGEECGESVHFDNEKFKAKMRDKFFNKLN